MDQLLTPDAVDLIRENPYILAKDFPGMGFLTADTIARHLGVDNDDPERVRACIVHMILKSADDGHVFAEKENLLSSHAKKALLACRDIIRSAYPTAEIILYGSQARGQAGVESDMDLLVLLQEETTADISDHIQDMLYEISLAEDLVICAIVRNTTDWNSPFCRAMPFYHNIQREGIQVA